jgi:hypothetical protein
MENKKSNGIITETVVIAGVTLIAYLSLVCYQYSFLHYFGLPSYFLEFDMMTMLFIILILFVFFTVFFICISPLMKVLRDEKFNFKKHALKLLLFYVPYLIMIVPYYDLRKSILFNCIIEFVLLVVWTAQIVIINKKFKSSLAETPKSNFLKKIEDKYGYFPIMLIMLSIMFILSSFVAGKNIAQWQEEYLVINTDPIVAIIKPYSESFLAISFDEKAKTFNRNIYLISKSDISSKQLKISREHIGPLTNGSYYIESDIFTTFARITFSYIRSYFDK